MTTSTDELTLGTTVNVTLFLGNVANQNSGVFSGGFTITVTCTSEPEPTPTPTPTEPEPTPTPTPTEPEPSPSPSPSETETPDDGEVESEGEVKGEGEVEAAADRSRSLAAEWLRRCCGPPVFSAPEHRHCGSLAASNVLSKEQSGNHQGAQKGPLISVQA